MIYPVNSFDLEVYFKDEPSNTFKSPCSVEGMRSRISYKRPISYTLHLSTPTRLNFGNLAKSLNTMQYSLDITTHKSITIEINGTYINCINIDKCFFAVKSSPYYYNGVLYKNLKDISEN